MAKFIEVSELKEGMELEFPVKNKFGQTLLAANIRLEEKHKLILKTWGIDFLYVKDEGNNSNEFNYDAETKSAAEESLNKRIKWIPQNLNELDLYEMALQAVLEKDL